MNINTLKYIQEFIKIKNKKSEIIPFILNTPQIKLYEIIKSQKILNKPVRIIILKARQMGFSTLTEAILFKETATKQNINTGIITHVDSATNNLFEMNKLMYQELPEQLKPDIKKSNAKEVVFNRDNGTGLNSKIKCMTAGSKGVGRSDTFNNLHISELAFWQGDKKKILTGLLQAVPNTSESIVIIESTANGFDYFKALWDKAVKNESDYIPLFIGWNELEEYKMLYTGFELTQDELELKQIYNLTNEQISWRRWCIENNCGGDIEQFKQEYPITPEEAFISTGNSVFNKEEVIKRISRIKEPLTVGNFEYDYDGLKITNIKWVEDSKGYIKLYELPKKGYPYVLAGDTAGDGSDYFTGQCINNITSNQVAVLKHKLDEDLYVKQMYCLGMYYNQALIGIETNFSTYPNKELERLLYPKIYVREKEDTYTHNILKSFGFKTTLLTRPIILAELIRIIRENIDLINDKDTLLEFLTFIKNEKNRMEAQLGSHDDLVIALAIVYYIRTQQSMIAEILEEEDKLPYAFETNGEEESYW
ncbi:MAG: hypothetical protein RR290_00665 [Clostridia bacterium]